MRRHAVALACLTAAMLIALVATADHTWKGIRINRADVSEWYCKHRGLGCGGPSSERIEAHWILREWGYALAFALLAGYGTIRLVGDVIVDRAAVRTARRETRPDSAPEATAPTSTTSRS